MSTGFSIDAVNIIRNNRSLLRKRKFKDIKILVIETSGKTELEFKKVSSEELLQIKTKIRKRAKEDARKEAVIYFVSTTITLSFFYWLIYT